MKNDPIKNINSEYYLNDVSLKSRYNLMKVNQKNGRNGLDTGSHWAKDSVYPLIDDDIKHNLKKQYFDTIYNINKNNSELFSEMTNLKKTLSSLNQTSLVSESFRNLKNKMNSGIDIIIKKIFQVYILIIEKINLGKLGLEMIIWIIKN